MASRGPRARYYPGANSLTLFSAQGSNPLEDCKVYGKGVQKVYDRSVKGYVYSISGGLQSKLQLPKLDSKAGLQLLHHFLVFQVYVPSGQHFSVELRVSDTNYTRRKMYFSTSFSDIKATPLHCQIPISMVIRNKWLSLAFHVADLFNSCFRGGVSFRSIDIIVLGPVCKLRKIFTMRCRITETSPHGYLEEVSEDCLPQEHLYAVGVDSCVQILDMASLQSAVLQNAESNVEDSRPGLGPESGLSARKGAHSKIDHARIVHVAFGTRMPLPLSTVQINTSLPHDNICPPYPKERNGRQLPIESIFCEPKPVANMVSRALSAATHHETEGLRRKVDSVLLEYKTRGSRAGHASCAAPSVEEKDPANSPRTGTMEADSANHDANSLSAMEPLPELPPNCTTSTETPLGNDSTQKRPGKGHGAKKRESQTSLPAKQPRKESQTRSKEYKPSRYMDSPPGSPPCGWDSMNGGNKTEDRAFNAHFLEGSWINNQTSEPVESGKHHCLSDGLKEKILLSKSRCQIARLDKQEMTRAINSERLKPTSDRDYRQIASPLGRDASNNVNTDPMFGVTVNGSDYHKILKIPDLNKHGERSGGQRRSSDGRGEDLGVPLFMFRGDSPAAEMPGWEPHSESDLLELPEKDSKQEDKLLFDPQDELLFEKLLLESKKDVHGSDTFMNEKITKSLSKGAADSLDFESESDKVRDALDFSFEEALLKMKANRTSESFVLEPVRSAFEIDPLQSKRSWQISADTPVANLPTGQATSQEDEVAGLVVNKGRPDEDLDLLYDPTLDCYYDPKTNRYYELK
ncbi:hypothetical protein MPTK1_1g16110 [Marchantia polymorpha subsp. ruderalis]|uniref:CFA20 domain-containing protein n=2 Tax=Marchantia polymorpha TaxID=3197 RepID=A0AAF6AQP9_MARPO|nr:hypothetical protein MARPO_0033s0049 [Marchantia polymorpha]BBM98769.1 hypothetical protein Mp_1g16110 [Marchantia polymorpha subsp. ruderalis]|eukprot:PTQ41634.1 hypothetical protein MARPO_0033s0049 [Marchantia polymorpha]